MACLKTAGTDPEARQVFINFRMHGPTTLKTSLRRRGGMLSEGQYEGRRWWTISDRWGSDTGSNWSHSIVHLGGEEGSAAAEGIDLIALIFSTKNIWKFLHRVGVGTIAAVSRGFTRESNTLNRI